MAKKPKTPKIKDSPYRKPFINYQEKLLFKRNIIPYFHFIKDKMDPIKKPNYRTIKYKNNSIIILNHPEIYKRYILKYVKPNFRDNYTSEKGVALTYTINPNFYRKFQFL
jgi:hypothetical protein